MKRFKDYIKEQIRDVNSYGFAIGTSPEDVIKANAEDKGVKLDSKAWDAINKDTAQIERNVLNLLNKWSEGASDQGHGGKDDELVGNVYVKPKSKQEKVILKQLKDDPVPVSMLITGAKDKDIFKNTSKYANLMAVELDFFK
jgi:hypothetical protein